jgi:hypothetical protein
MVVLGLMAFESFHIIMKDKIIYGVIEYTIYILQVYFGKTKEMVCTLRPPSEVVMRLPDS